MTAFLILFSMCVVAFLLTGFLWPGYLKGLFKAEPPPPPPAPVVYDPRKAERTARDFMYGLEGGGTSRSMAGLCADADENSRRVVTSINGTEWEPARAGLNIAHVEERFRASATISLKAKTADPYDKSGDIKVLIDLRGDKSNVFCVERVSLS
ncbi:hypothetical protein [Actinokineospora pegani]|uniref:hypothetical protein n=1 Tax=Actinokineospora pegani TaxID=2654637 RepID=UPI0012E9DAC1|nr:hypothetical protein [Actinokineospora pegani]